MEFIAQMGISNLDKLEAQRIICLFLAQNENPAKPHEQLGFKTAQSAFAEIGKLFRRKKIQLRMNVTPLIIIPIVTE